MSREQIRPEDVRLYMDKWVTGLRARAYFGEIRSSQAFQHGEQLDDAIAQLNDRLRIKAAHLGANSVVEMGPAYDVELSADGFVVSAKGCPAYLEDVLPASKPLPSPAQPVFPAWLRCYGFAS